MHCTLMLLCSLCVCAPDVITCLCVVAFDAALLGAREEMHVIHWLSTVLAREMYQFLDVLCGTCSD